MLTIDERNGWLLFGHLAFQQRLDALWKDVEALVESRPDTFQDHPKWKLLDCVMEAIELRVPRDPAAAEFLCASLGNGGRWRRVKSGMPPRYRMFFQFRTQSPRTIIFAWFNDDGSIRKEGDKNDVYEAFRRLLKKGKIPSSFEELQRECKPIPKLGTE